jgi:hypothetical protein
MKQNDVNGLSYSYVTKPTLNTLHAPLEVVVGLFIAPSQSARTGTRV